MYSHTLMRSTLLTALLASSLLADTYYADTPPPAYAVPVSAGPYVGLGYGYSSVSDDYFEYYPNEGLSVQTDINYNNLLLQAGFQYNPFIAFEFRYWLSVSGGDYSIDSNYPPLYPSEAGSYDDFDAWGFYLKPMYPVTPEFSIYGLIGFAGTYVSGEPGWDLLDEGDFSYGLGISFAITPNILMFADYVRLFDGAFTRYGYDFDTDQDTTVDAFSIGLSYRF